MSVSDSCRVTDLFDFGVTQLVRAQPAKGPVQLKQLQGVAIQPPANQETWEMRRQEEQWADVSLKTDRGTRYSTSVHIQQDF